MSFKHFFTLSSRHLPLALPLLLCLFLLPSSTFGGTTSAFPHLDRVLRPRASTSTQEDAVRALLGRLLPAAAAAKFAVHVNPRLLPRQTFVVSAAEGFVRVEGTSGVAVASGIYYYLKSYCGCSVTWAGRQLRLPHVLASVNAVRVTSNGAFRYYQNVCTQSYSFAFWNWSRWEKELDWMALNGINLAPAFVAQESVWRRVWSKMGLKAEEIDAFFGGPAFLAWARMGNLKGWGGPLPAAWRVDRLELQRKILRRMRELGMTPVLPGFGGFVPDAFARVYPRANVTRLNWFMDKPYNGVLQLQPTDPLFANIGGKFVAEMSSTFDNETGHVYNVDTYNEMAPTSGDLGYLADSAKAVLAGLRAGDPDAVWMMQGWLFLEGFWTKERAKAYVTAVPKDRHIILDLNSPNSPQYSRLDSYFGHPFIYCMIHNFGGQNSMFGYLPLLNEKVVEALHDNVTAYSLIGTGLTPEGINQNEIQYELMNEFGWRKSRVDLPSWTRNFYVRRYGIQGGGDVWLDKAWSTLLDSVYSCATNGKLMQDHLYRPSLKKSYGQCYPRHAIAEAWKLFILAAGTSPTLGENPLFLYDLVDVTREALGVGASRLIHEMIGGYAGQNASAIASAGHRLQDLWVDLDRVLGSDPHFLLGAWIRDARAIGGGGGGGGGESDAAALLEFNARAQVTTWDDRVNDVLNDYAAKQWAGLTRDYYAPRWRYFASELIEAVLTKKQFDAGRFAAEVFALVEAPFAKASKKYASTPKGNAVEIVVELERKWRDELFPELSLTAEKKRKIMEGIKFKKNGELLCFPHC